MCSSSATSGAERHVYSLSTNLRRRGHAVQVVTPGPCWLTTILEDARVPVHTTHMKGAGWWRTMGYLVRTVRRQRIDVIHTHLTRSAYIAHAAGIVTRVPIVTSVHIANNDDIYRRLARGRNRLVAVSNFVAGMLHGKGVPKRFIDTVYNGTDFMDIAPASPHEVRREFGLSDDAKIVGLVARVCREKGHVEMIHAMGALKSSHPDAHLMLVGMVEDTFRPEAEQMVRDHGLEGRVTMTGVRHDVARLLDSFTLSTLPSHMETFGVAAIEAMAREKAVVASRMGALPEVVRHEQTGLLVDLEPDAIAQAVSYLLTNAPERDEMGRRGRRLVQQKFSLDEMSRRFEDVYTKAVSA